jgi:hypothetical protein
METKGFIIKIWEEASQSSITIVIYITYIDIPH